MNDNTTTIDEHQKSIINIYQRNDENYLLEDGIYKPTEQIQIKSSIDSDNIKHNIRLYMILDAIHEDH